MAPVSSEIDRILTNYFYSWRPYAVIVKKLRRSTGMKRSVSWLRAQYRRLGLKRRGVETPERILRATIKLELQCSNKLLGYRAMWKLIREKYKYIVRRDTVMRIMKQEDPDGVKLRKQRRLKRRIYRNKGPNYVWHIDGYDKLSPYGLTIHACFDGFSRKILWIKLATTNSHPGVIVKYFLEAVDTVGGCPSIVRCDPGTENCLLAKAQVALRLCHGDDLAGERSFMYGPSTANVKIEGWWSHVKRFKTWWWIDLYLVANGILNPHDVHRQCLAYSVVPMLERELEEFVDNWNSHTIRSNRTVEVPSGIPDDIFEMPEEFGTFNYIHPINRAVWSHLIKDAKNTPSFIPHQFKDDADEFLSNAFNMSVLDIDHNNVKDVFQQLVDHFA